jgi:hypothetical protein
LTNQHDRWKFDHESWPGLVPPVEHPEDRKQDGAWQSNAECRKEPGLPVGTGLPSKCPADCGQISWEPGVRHDRIVSVIFAPELPGIHFHDLRHAGNLLTADAGANLRELMERMGHSTTRAALIYLHGGDQRQRANAETVSDMVRSALGSQPERPAESL